MIVLGFKHFQFKASSMMNRVNHLMGSILDEKITKEEMVDGAKLWKVLKKKESDKKKLITIEKESENKRDRKANDKLNKDELM